MSYNLIVTTVAEQQTDDACNYYEEQQAGLAERFLSELYDTYLKIANHPEYYGFISPNDQLRDIKLHSFPYVVGCECPPRNNPDPKGGNYPTSLFCS